MKKIVFSNMTVTTDISCSTETNVELYDVQQGNY